jgi:regulator of CtrA degradation
MGESNTISEHFDRRLIDSLYVEALVLADEARAFFDRHGEARRIALAEMDRVTFACESLKVTTRLMHVIAWLLAQRAILNGELAPSARGDDRFRLGVAAVSVVGGAEDFNPELTAVILAREDIYQRVARLERQLVGRARGQRMAPPSPARDLLSRLERAF